MEKYSTTKFDHSTDNLGYSVAERLSTSEVSPEVEGLILLERDIPVEIGVNLSLRPKILDSCGMACTFCHNEGTPVAMARDSKTLLPNPRYRGERVSVFEDTNGVDFMPGVMISDEAFKLSLITLRDSLGLTELHLTGGEPTLHKDLPGIIQEATSLGFSVKMTSNGENGERVLPACAAAGLKKVNFSIFGTTPEELAEVQGGRFNNTKLAKIKIDALHKSIQTALAHGIGADANIVMSDSRHGERVRRIIDEYDSRVSIRILNDLDAGDASYVAIYQLLADLDAVPVRLYVEAGGSNSRVKYLLPSGREIYFKQIRRTTLPDTCNACIYNNDRDCKEGYYGVRLYVDADGAYKAGVCLQRMDLTQNIEEFASQAIIEEINNHRNNELAQLVAHYKDRIEESYE